MATASIPLKDYMKMLKWNDTLMKALKNARRRCEEPSNNRFRYYGAKGIRCFLIPEDMVYLARKYKIRSMKKPQLHRKDSTKDYTLYNCMFIEASEHSRITHTGKKRSAESKRRMSLAGGTQYGENHPMVKLTYKKVAEIRNSGLSGVALAKKYNVSTSCICAIRKGLVWLR